MKWVITGAAGFIGTNLSERLITEGHQVLLIDNLSRIGVADNADYLFSKYGVKIELIDITDNESLVSRLNKFANPDVIVNLAGQVSFMSSILNPRRDFEINATGTLNLLEYVRIFTPSSILVGLSSNKIYGDLNYLNILENELKYFAPDFPEGFDESLKLDFQGPYGCSKGIADQYLIDYNRMYGLKTISFRQSSVYGPFQKPVSDQGWVSFFLGEVKANRIINLNGLGKQVRDILHVQDLVDLFLQIPNIRLQDFGVGVNVGGGITNSLSILELFDLLEKITGKRITFAFGDFRPRDQKVFISNNSTVKKITSWNPKIDIVRGLSSLI